MASPHVPVPRRDASGRWDLAEAKACQLRLRRRVSSRDRVGPVRWIAGADVAYDRATDRHFAAVVLLDARTMDLKATAVASGRTRFPYIPGYLSFREAPGILAAMDRLDRRPDLLMVDGHGVAHPRGFGIACHLGVLVDLPTIGVAKSVLVGQPGAPSHRRGGRAPLRLDGARIGTVLRTRTGVAPVYVSTGHRIGLETAVRWVLRCGSGYRLPEPTRRAHLAVTALRAGRTSP